MSNRRHLFISHHHADDSKVDSLIKLASKGGYDVRNSSIRAKPANQARLDKGLVKDETIRRLLSMKISWASTIVVLIGKETHSRPWVNWEISKAHELGKRIVGVYERGGTKADIPEKFEDYGNALVNWNSSSLMAAVDGTESPFQDPDGSERPPVHDSEPTTC